MRQARERVAYSSLYAVPLDGSANLVYKKGKMVSSARAEEHLHNGRCPEGLEESSTYAYTVADARPILGGDAR